MPRPRHSLQAIRTALEAAIAADPENDAIRAGMAEIVYLTTPRPLADLVAEGHRQFWLWHRKHGWHVAYIGAQDSFSGMCVSDFLFTIEDSPALPMAYPPGGRVIPAPGWHLRQNRRPMAMNPKTTREADRM